MSVQEDDELSKLTEEMPEAITQQEPIDEMVKPISPEEIQTDYQTASEPEPKEEEKLQQKGYIKTAKPRPKSKPGGKGKTQFKHMSLVKNELRKYTESMKKIDTAIKDIRKQLKSLKTGHQSDFRNLERQVSELGKKISIGGRFKSPKYKKPKSKKKIMKTKSKNKNTRS